MSAINDFVKRALDRSGFERAIFAESNLPAASENILAVPFFGDLRSTFLMSSYLLRRYKESHPSKYIIFCSWPGFGSLFPYVDEYWQPRDRTNLSTLSTGATGFGNVSDVAATYGRNLVNHFETLFPEEWQTYYDNGFQRKFWDAYRDVKLFLPEVPSASQLTDDFKGQVASRTGHKVVIFPARRLRSWQRGKTEMYMGNRDFWVALAERLLKENITPVVYQNYWTYDLSRDFSEQCIYLATDQISTVLAAMRLVGCVLDIHSGISRLAIAARCPFVSVDERIRYINEREYEIDDLSCMRTPRQYIFSFASYAMAGTVSDWNASLFDNIVARVKSFIPTMNRVDWDSPTEFYDVVDYGKVQQKRVKRLGANFIRKY